MPSYNYIAKDGSGRIIKSALEGRDKVGVYKSLKDRGLIIVSITEQNLMNKDFSLSIFNKVGVKDLAIFSKQFASLMKAGIPILKTLDILRKQTENKKLAEVLNKIFEDVQKGSILSETMRAQKGIFPEMFINMIEAGEVSGTLDNSFEKMAIHYEKSYKIKKKVTGSLVYPCVVTLICLICVVLLMALVVPMFTKMYSGMGAAKMPLPTKMLIGTSNFMRSQWYILLFGAGGLIGGFVYFKRTAFGKKLIDEKILTIPIVSNMLRKYYAALLARTLSTLLGAGIPLLKALELCEKITANVVIKTGLNKAREEVMRGGGLAKPIENINIYPMMVHHMISIGEEAGALDSMLEKTADYFEEETENTVGQMMTLIEPLTLIVMAGVIGGIVSAVMLPMFNIGDMVK